MLKWRVFKNIFKKIGTAVLAVVMAASFTGCINNPNETYTQEDIDNSAKWLTIIDDSEYGTMVTRCDKRATKVVIPDYVDTIGGYADAYFHTYHGAFEDCEDLTSVIIPNGVTTIDTSAF